MRFFLRVDGVIVRLNDTRIYHQVSSLHYCSSTDCSHVFVSLQAGTDFLTREICSKEARIPDLKVWQVT